MRKLVDANVVLRYMLRDDDTMSPKAEQTIHKGAEMAGFEMKFCRFHP